MSAENNKPNDRKKMDNLEQHRQGNTQKGKKNKAFWDQDQILKRIFEGYVLCEHKDFKSARVHISMLVRGDFINKCEFPSEVIPRSILNRAISNMERYAKLGMILQNDFALKLDTTINLMAIVEKQIRRDILQLDKSTEMSTLLKGLKCGYLLNSLLWRSSRPEMAAEGFFWLSGFLVRLFSANSLTEPTFATKTMLSTSSLLYQLGMNVEAELAFPIFRRSVFESRRAIRGIFRPRVKSDLKSTFQNQWPRNPTEKLISAYFERPLDQFVAVLEALRSVLAAAPVFATVEATKAILDTNVYEVIEELFLAGFSILCPNLLHTLARFRVIYENSQKPEEGPESRLMLLDFIAVDAYAYATPDLLMNAFDEESDVQSDAPNPVPRTNLRGLLEFMKMCLAYDQYDIFECLHDNANYSLKKLEVATKNPCLRVFKSRLRQLFSIYLYRRNIHLPNVDNGLPQSSQAVVYSLENLGCLRRPDRWRLANLALNSNVLDENIFEKDLKVAMEILKVLLDYGRRKMASVPTTILEPLTAPRLVEIPVWLLLLMSAREHLVDVKKVNDVENFAIQWTTQFLYLIRGVVEKLVLGQISEEERLRRLLIMTDILMWKSEDDASNEEGPGADGWRTSVKPATRKLLKQALEKLAWIKQFLGELMFSMEVTAFNKGSQSVSPKFHQISELYAEATAMEVKLFALDEHLEISECDQQERLPSRKKHKMRDSKNSLIKALLYCEYATYATTDESRREFLDKAISALKVSRQAQPTLETTGTGVKANGSPILTVVGRSRTKIALHVPAWEDSLDAETFHLLGRRRTGFKDVTPHLSDKKLHGSGVVYPANTSEVIEICKLEPDEEYLFAVAFTKKHRPSSEKSCLGPSTAPILACPTLCEKIALGHIAQTAFDSMSTKQLEEAENMLASYFLKEQTTSPPAGSLYNPYSLCDTAMANSGKILQLHCAQAIFLRARARLLNRPHAPKKESMNGFIKEQFLDIRICHRLLIALDLNMRHKSLSNAMAVIETIVLLLRPYLQLQFEIQDITEIQKTCLTHLVAISESFANTFPRKKTITRLPSTECIRQLANACSRSLLRHGNQRLALEVLERAKSTLQAFALPNPLETSDSKGKNRNAAFYSSCQSDEEQTKLSNTGKENMKVINDPQLAAENFERRRLEDLRAIQDLIAYLTISSGKSTYKLSGKDEPIKVYSAIQCLPLTSAFTEVFKLQGRKKFLQYIRLLYLRGLRSGCASVVCTWHEAIAQWQKRRWTFNSRIASKTTANYPLETATAPKRERVKWKRKMTTMYKSESPSLVKLNLLASEAYFRDFLNDWKTFYNIAYGNIDYRLPSHSSNWFAELVEGSINENIDSYLRTQADLGQFTDELFTQGSKKAKRVDSGRSYILSTSADPISGSSTSESMAAKLEPHKLKQRISRVFLCLQRAIEFTRRSSGAALGEAGWLEVASTLAKTTLALSQHLAIMQSICQSRILPNGGGDNNLTLLLQPRKTSKQQQQQQHEMNTDPTDLFFADLTALADKTCLAECCWRPWQACAENLLDTLASSQHIELKDAWQRRFILQAADVLLSAGKFENLFSLACRCILFDRMGWSNTFASIAKLAQKKVNLRVMALVKNNFHGVSASKITPIAHCQLKNWWSCSGQAEEFGELRRFAQWLCLQTTSAGLTFTRATTLSSMSTSIAPPRSTKPSSNSLVKSLEAKVGMLGLDMKDVKQIVTQLKSVPMESYSMLNICCPAAILRLESDPQQEDKQVQPYWQNCLQRSQYNLKLLNEGILAYSNSKGPCSEPVSSVADALEKVSIVPLCGPDAHLQVTSEVKQVNCKSLWNSAANAVEKVVDVMRKAGNEKEIVLQYHLQSKLFLHRGQRDMARKALLSGMQVLLSPREHEKGNSAFDWLTALNQEGLTNLTDTLGPIKTCLLIVYFDLADRFNLMDNRQGKGKLNDHIATLILSLKRATLMGRRRLELLHPNCWHAKRLFGELDRELAENGVLQNEFISAMFRAYGSMSGAERWREAWQLADLLHHASTFIFKSEVVSQQASLLEIDCLIELGEYFMAFEIIQDLLQKGSGQIYCVRSKVIGSTPMTDERTRRSLLLCRENEEVFSKMLALDDTTIPLQGSLSMQFLELLIAKLQFCCASQIQIPPLRCLPLTPTQREKSTNVIGDDTFVVQPPESKKLGFRNEFWMHLAPLEDIQTVGVPVQGLTKDVLCSNAERICWKVVRQMKADDVANCVLMIKTLLTLAEICIVHHCSRSGIIVALKALRFLERRHEETAGSGRSSKLGINQIFESQLNATAWLQCRAVLAKCQLADLSSVYNLRYRTVLDSFSLLNYVSLSVPEEPDLLENIQRGREEAEALGLEKFIRIFKLYEELHRCRMQMEPIDYSPKKESQSQYTLEELFIRVSLIDSLAETQQRNHQDLLEEVLDLKKHLITSTCERYLTQTPKATLDAVTPGFCYMMACLRLREILFRVKLTAIKAEERGLQKQVFLSVREELSELLSHDWNAHLVVPFLQFDILAQTCFIDLQLLLLGHESVSLSSLLNNMRKALYLAIIILGDARAKSFVWSMVAVLTAILMKNRNQPAASALTLLTNKSSETLSEAATIGRPASEGNSETNVLSRLLWTSMQRCCTLAQRPTTTPSTTSKDTALPNLPMHLAYDLIAPKVLGALKQSYKSFYENKFAEKYTAISEDPSEHCELLLSIMTGLSTTSAADSEAPSSTSDEEPLLKRHFGGKDKIALLAPTMTTLEDYREKLTSLYSSRSLHQNLSEGEDENDDGIASDLEADQLLLLEPQSIPLYRPDAVYWGQKALTLHQLMVAGPGNSQQNAANLTLEYSALEQLEALLTDSTTEYEDEYAAWLQHLEPITPASYENKRIKRLTQVVRSGAGVTAKYTQNELLFLSTDVKDLRGNVACLVFMTKGATSTASKRMGSVSVEVYVLPHRAELRKLSVDLKKILLSNADPIYDKAPRVSQGHVIRAGSGSTQTQPVTIAKKRSIQDPVYSATEKQIASWLARFDALWTQRREFVSKRPLQTKKSRATSAVPIGVLVQPTLNNLRYFAAILHTQGFCGKLEKSEVQDYLSRPR